MSAQKLQRTFHKLKSLHPASVAIGALLKEKRLEKGFSQKEVSDRLGYGSAQYVSDWERGYSAIPTGKLAELAKMLNIEQDRLFEMLLEFSIERLTENMRAEYQKVKKSKS
jgi:transcriptional regulator with XRE-family HTH domain